MKNARLGGLALLALAGCGPNYDHTTIDNVITSTNNAEVSLMRIRVAKGTIVAAHIEAFDSNNDSMTTDISSDNDDILKVGPIVTDHNYGFQGNTAGRATISIKANGELVVLIDALVEEQPLP